MNLPNPPSTYDVNDQAQTRNLLMQVDMANLKQGVIFDKILMRDTADGTIKTVKITSGEFVIT